MHAQAPAAPPSGPASGRKDPWIETREGGLFFVNALLIFPHVMVSVPLLTRIFVRSRGGLQGEAVIVDTFPLLAEHLLPRLGWLLVVPIGLILLNLTWEAKPWPRRALGAFLALHLAALAWTVSTWLSWTGGTLPGGWP
jgi:hypothetical protein